VRVAHGLRGQARDALRRTAHGVPERVPGEQFRQEGVLHRVGRVRGCRGQFLLYDAALRVQHLLAERGTQQRLTHQRRDLRSVLGEYLGVQDERSGSGRGIALPAQALDPLAQRRSAGQGRRHQQVLQYMGGASPVVAAAEAQPDRDSRGAATRLVPYQHGHVTAQKLRA
jgi:hypothetical protein